MDQIDLKPTPKVNNLSETLAQIGESEMLNRLKVFMEYGQIDDDTALLSTFNSNLLINTDVLVENVHFTEETNSSEDVGWKAITTNLSDLAASGSEDFLGFTVGLIAPPATQWKWVEGVYKGMQKAINQFGGKLIGGDCSKGKEKIVSITAIGKLGKLRLHRSHAIPGDYLVSSGPHGLSRLGLALLRQESLEELKIIPESLRLKAIKTHQRPYPQIEALKLLKKCKPSNLPWRAAGIDSSDGLLEAVNSLCKSSNCQAILDRSCLPIHNRWPKGTLWEEWCISGGEDYQLIISLPPRWAKEWVAIMPEAQVFGKITKGIPQITWADGSEILPNNFSSFIHF